MYLTEERPVPTSSSPVCTLDASHRPLIESHLQDLGAADRYLRFGYAASDAQIARYVAGLRFGHDEVWGVFDDALELLAMAHLAYGMEADARSSAEFGVSVRADGRGLGLGRRLFDRAVVHARNHGVEVLHIHALSENVAMLRIARQAGAEVVRSGSESACRLRLPPADFGSQVGELLEDQLARTHVQWRVHCQRLGHWWRRWWRRNS